MKLPSGCVVPGSCLHVILGCRFVNFCGGLFKCTFLTIWFTWEGAPCQVGTRLVKLAGLSSKSTCNICCTWSSGCSFGFCIPVSSLQYQLIGKRLGCGTYPVGELNKIDLILVWKVGELYSSARKVGKVWVNFLGWILVALFVAENSKYFPE